MLSVYKYKLNDTICWIEAPVINWLDIDWQEREGCFCAWALVNLDGPDRKFQFFELDTGKEVSEEMLKGYQHLGTVNMNYYVAHWFVGEYDNNNKIMIDEDENVSE